jgi:hypothetical protein
MTFEDRVFEAMNKFDGHITHGSFELVMKKIRAELAMNGNLDGKWPVIYQPKWRVKWMTQT